MSIKIIQRSKVQGAPVFLKMIPEVGELLLYPIDLDRHLLTLHDWVQRDYARFWGMQGKTLADLKDEYERLVSSDHAMAFVALMDGQMVFLCELYEPAHDLIGQHYEVKEGDLGMHVLVGPAERYIPNFTWHVFTTIMDFMFSDPQVRRIVVEPDVNNAKIHILNKKAGFVYEKNIQFPHKTAAMAFCTRSQYSNAYSRELSSKKQIMKHHLNSPQQSVKHLQAEYWTQANRLHLCKAISEFAHERLIEPELQYEKNGWGYYRLFSQEYTDIEYWFCAQRLSLDHWYIDRKTLRKSQGGTEASLDSVLFFLEFKSQLNISEEQLPYYLEEIISTLNGSTFMMAQPNLSVEKLALADYQTFEHAMTSGHPCFVANNGRIGFGADDYQQYAPEADQPVQLLWLAGHKSRAGYNGVEELGYHELLLQELGGTTLAQFYQILSDMGLSPRDYFLIPVHPWQWFNKLAIICAPDIAQQQLVCLGYGPDAYNAQQSIRTFYNLDHPEKFYTKTALGIINMGFVRGLTPYFMDSTPSITKWIKEVVGKDPVLQKVGFTLLCEVATVGYHNFYYERFGRSCVYNKMLSALWRESPASVVEPGQQLMTMAALLHIDFEGNALLPELIKASRRTTKEWIRQYLKCYLTPLVHCFYQHDLVFMPHGENLILVMEDQFPVKAIMKDITEEICVFGLKDDMPDKAKRVCYDMPEEIKTLSILTDVFDCFFRFLNQVLVAHCDMEEPEFWGLVAENLLEYQQEHPELAAKFERYDLFAPEFTLSCLNRLQLRNHKQMLDLADPIGSLQFVGTLKNPIAPFKITQLSESALFMEH